MTDQYSALPDPKTPHRAHPWHGVSAGEHAPEQVNCYIEIVPTDTVKYELDKETGLLKVDRPQKFSSLCPTLYGFIPQTYCGHLVAEHCMEKTKLKGIDGDHDPMDICVLTEKTIPRGDILLSAIPIGGFRMIDGNEADDKIIAVMTGDFVYGQYKDVSELPSHVVARLKHYFVTYKEAPNESSHQVKITHTYGHEEAYEVIRRSQKDYQTLMS
ncbi:MAG: inorganic pyrophosphatase [Chlamydiia bacterium]|nr:inorganic pyrophosphatase [Chlamydiia bacterium]